MKQRTNKSLKIYDLNFNFIFGGSNPSWGTIEKVMAKQQDRWSSLSNSEKADLMKMYLQAGVKNLSEMKAHYNKFDTGGSTQDPDWTPEERAQFLRDFEDRLRAQGYVPTYSGGELHPAIVTGALKDVNPADWRNLSREQQGQAMAQRVSQGISDFGRNYVWPAMEIAAAAIGLGAVSPYLMGGYESLYESLQAAYPVATAVGESIASVAGAGLGAYNLPNAVRNTYQHIKEGDVSRAALGVGQIALDLGAIVLTPFMLNRARQVIQAAKAANLPLPPIEGYNPFTGQVEKYTLTEADKLKLFESSGPTKFYLDNIPEEVTPDINPSTGLWQKAGVDPYTGLPAEVPPRTPVNVVPGKPVKAQAPRVGADYDALNVKPEISFEQYEVVSNYANSSNRFKPYYRGHLNPGYDPYRASQLEDLIVGNKGNSGTLTRSIFSNMEEERALEEALENGSFVLSNRQLGWSLGEQKGTWAQQFGNSRIITTFDERLSTLPTNHYDPFSAHERELLTGRKLGFKVLSKEPNELGGFDWRVEIANPYKFGGQLRRRISIF